MLSRRLRRACILALAASAAAVLAAQAGAGASSGASPDSGAAATTTGPPTGAALTVANDVAHYEANTTTPSSPSIQPPGMSASLASGNGWPSNVTTVSYLQTDRDMTANWVGVATAPDDRPVVVVQMTGRFAVETTAPTLPNGTPPPKQVETGTTELIVADASSGTILDYSLSNNPAISTPAFESVYSS